MQNEHNGTDGTLSHEDIPLASKLESPLTGETSVLRHSPIIVALLALIFIRLLTITFAVRLAGDDGDRYLQESINLVRFGVFSHLMGAPPSPTAHDLPLFPAMMAAVLASVKSVVATKYIVSATNVLLYAFCAVMTSQLCLRLTGSLQAALATMMVMAASPESVPYSIFYMPESLFVVLLVGTNLLAFCYWKSGAIRYIASAFVLSALAVYAKPIILFYGAVLCCVVIWRGVANKRIVFAIVSCLLGLLLQAAVLSPWLYRNHRDFKIAGLSSIVGYNSFIYNYGGMLEDQLGTKQSQHILDSKLTQLHREVPDTLQNPMLESDYLKRIAAQGVIQHPGWYAKTVLKRQPKLYGGTGTVAFFYIFGIDKADLSNTTPGSKIRTMYLTVQIISWALLGAIYILFLRGIFRQWQSGNWLLLSAVLVNLLYFALLIGPVTFTRYRMPMLPFFAIAAGASLLPVTRQRTRPVV